MRPARGGLVGAVDLGGTKIRSIIVDSTGIIRSVDQRPTEAAQGREAVIARIINSVQQAALSCSASVESLDAVGVAAPGPVDFERGVLLEAPNLSGWKDVPLAAILTERLGRPAYLENDANAAAFGEHRLGAARGVQHMVYLTISTGIGGGLVLNGQLYRGVDGAAGELGHVVVAENGPLDDCGMHGCLEIMASGTAIARMAREAASAGESDALARAAEANVLTSKEVSDLADAGDSVAQAILDRASHYLALGLASFINIFNPQLFVIGGGASQIREDFIKPAFERARQIAFSRPAASVRLLAPALGGDSGALGAAALAREAVANQQNTDACS